MKTSKLALFLSLALLLVYGCSREDPEFEGPFDVPRGFVVENALPPEKTDSLIQITFDSFGRPVVSKERGHPTILLDEDGDGVFETEKVFSDRVQYLQGMWFDGRTLYAIGNDTENDQAGLYKLEDVDGDDAADTFEQLHLFTGPMGEHGPHDIRLEPGGEVSVLVGNHSFVPEEMIDPLSPLRGYKEWQLLERYMDARGHAVDIMAPGGAVLRLDRGKMIYSLVVGGFRNPYNHAYNWEGELFTFDSDMEWDINLPWYREVRSVHAVPGGDYGWRTGSGKFPDYYLDTLPPVEDLGRGSPVGVEFYRHHAYPEEYFDGFFQADWSRGRIVLSKMVRDGATYKTAEDSFDFVYGEPLNVTDIEVGPDGFLYFTMGGRDTEGGLYRVAYRGYRSNESWKQEEGAMAAIRQPQPLSSWGRAALQKRKQAMGESWGGELARVARNASAESYDRVQALMLLQRHGPRPDAELLRALAEDRDVAVRAAAIYVAGQHQSDRAKAIAAQGLKDSHAFVRRRAAEALVRQGLKADQPTFAPVEDIYALLNDEDRFVRYAGRIALERTPREQWKDLVLKEQNLYGAIEGQLALIRTAEGGAGLQPILDRQLALLQISGLSAEHTLRLLRALHIACIESEESCGPEFRKQVSGLLLPRFPSDDDRLNTEYSRTLAYCGQPEAIPAILQAMPQSEEKQPLQIHYVYCLRAIKEGWDKEQKQTLLSWFRKARNWRGGASFPGFINRLFDSSLEFFDPEEKQMAYAALPEFAPLEAGAAERMRRGNYVPAQVFARERGVRGVSEQEIFEYLMYDPMTMKAKPEEGKDFYEKECANCHRFGDMGKDYGPDLTTIANRFSRRDLIEAVLWPSKTISDQYQSYIIETKDGELYNGLIMSEDEEKVLVLLPEEERPLAIQKSNIKNRRISDVSTMPDQLLDGYSMREVSGLFAFLEKGQALAQASAGSR